MRISITCLLLLFCSVLFSQSYDKYRSAFLGFGPRSLNTDPGVITTSFIDNSPSMDQFQGEFQVEDAYNRLGFQFGYKWGNYNGLAHSLAFDAALGQHKGLGFTYSIGWNTTKEIGDGWFTWRAAAYLGFANYGFGIGEIENNAAYIQIGETQYFEDYLNLTLVSQTALYGPEIDLTYNFLERFDIWLFANYDLGSSNAKPELEFKSPDSDGGQSRLKLDDNPMVTYNGEQITSLPYNTSGLRLTVGFSYVWNRD